MTIGLVSHGKCERCGAELRDCICSEPCAECGGTEEDTFECDLCVDGAWLCSDCMAEHEELPRHRALVLIKDYDEAVEKIQALRVDAEARYDEGCMNAFDDANEAQSTLDELLPDFAEVLRDLLAISA